MPKTIAITPSWYWPDRTPRVSGVPPFTPYDLLVARRNRLGGEVPAVADLGSSLTPGELEAQVSSIAAAIDARGAAGQTVRVSAEPGVAQVALFLGAISAGCAVDETAAGVPEVALVLEGPGRESGGLSYQEAISVPAGPPVSGGTGDSIALILDSITEPGTCLAISQRALIARSTSLLTYFSTAAQTPWLVATPASGWIWSAAVGAALFSGGTAVVLPPGDADSLAAAAGAQPVQSVGVMDFADAFVATREAKKAAKGLRGQLSSLILPVSAAFDAGERRRIEKLFVCPGLTVFGLPETGPILASHPSWYLVESAGIPITNADVIPVDPRSGSRIQTLWELVEFAAVNVRSPMLASQRSSNGSWEPVGSTVSTGITASSDANGMIYLLPPGSY